MFGRIFLAIVVLSLPAGYYAYDSSQKAVIAEMVAAAQQSNVSAMAARVDWESLRSYLKTDIDDQKRFLGPRGAMVGPAQGDIARVVDYYVQPQNIDILFYQRLRLFPGVAVEAFIERVIFAPPFGFKVTLIYPKGAATSDPVMALMRDRVKVDIVYRLDKTLTWKIKEMGVPIYLVPRTVYPQPATQLFGRPGAY